MSSVAQQVFPVSLAQADIEFEERHRRQRQAEILELIAEKDNHLSDQYLKKCPCCGSRMHKHGTTEPRDLWTKAGLLKVTLRRVRCPQCTHLAVPAHELVADGLLSSVAEYFVEQCRINSFATSRKMLNKFLGVDIPVMTLHAYVRRQAEYFDDKIVKATEALYEAGLMPDVDARLEKDAPLYLAIDEGLIHEWSYCHGKTKTDDGKKRYVTAYCAVFFDGRKRISSEEAKPRYALTGRYGHASATTSTDQFFRELVTLSIKRGLNSNHHLFILTDGATYLSEAIKTYFPHATHLLDMYHLKSRVGELIKEEHSLYESAKKAIHTYNPIALLALIRAFQITEEREETVKKDLLKYITKNAQLIKNHRDCRTRVHGSASAEKAVDLMVARRFKNRGMSWTEKGCEVLLQFTVLDYNNELEAFWENLHARSGAVLTSPERPSAQIPVAKSNPQASKISASISSAHPLYYNQVHLIDCERTKGTNLN